MKTNYLYILALRLATASLLLGFQSAPVFANTLTVCASGCDQTDVQAAINIASPGDTVQIDSGIYHVNLNINKNVILQGQGAEQTMLDGSSHGTVVSILENGIVELNGLTIQNGLSDQLRTGGGITNLGKLTVTKCIVKGNKTLIINGNNDDANGAGINNQGDLDIQFTTISSNATETFGGAIYNSGKNVRIAYSSIVDNGSPSGTSGGIHNVADSGSSLAIHHSTISRNTGTAIYDGNGSNIILNNVTIAGSNDLSALVFGSTLRHSIIFNSIIVSPVGMPNCQFHFFSSISTIESIGGNVTSDASCQLNNPTDQQNSDHINLGPLQINAPGITPTHALLPGSSAIDTVISSGLSPCLASFQIQDQRGVSRPQGEGCDSGAFELRAPVATNDHFLTTQGQAIAIPYAALMSNDESPDRLAEGNILVLNGITGTKNGTLFVFSSTKNLTYIPNPGFTGQDSFTYTVSDGIHTSQSGTVIIDVQPINRPPVAQNDSYSVFAGQTLDVVPMSGVLANDRDPDGNPLSVIFDSPPDQGTLFLGGDGSFTYTPNPSFTGIDSFTYKASDGRAYSAVATVRIEVKPATGTVTIIEDAQPDSLANFNFTGSLGKFALDNPATDDGDLFGNSKTFEVAPGTYTINQTKLGGWYTGSITCTPLDSTVINTVANSVQVTVRLGDNKTCTFTNQKYGRVKVKVFNDLNKDRRYTSNEPGLLNRKTLLLNPTTRKWITRLTDGNGVAVFPNLKPNVYTVCEVLPPGWFNTTPAVLDPAYKKPCRKVSIGQGQAAQALFGNSK